MRRPIHEGTIRAGHAFYDSVLESAFRCLNTASEGPYISSFLILIFRFLDFFRILNSISSLMRGRLGLLSVEIFSISMEFISAYENSITSVLLITCTHFAQGKCHQSTHTHVVVHR
jgi:hypothetical protein